jgi:Domain of unknown function (DUF4224)
MSKFLDNKDIATLTGTKQKSKQITALKMMQIPFFTNPNGKAIVTIATIEGTNKDSNFKPRWTPPKR